jgi:cyclopropane fatty-acyl-phospholipid synthase-like methyltransferase
MTSSISKERLSPEPSSPGSSMAGPEQASTAIRRRQSVSSGNLTGDPELTQTTLICYEFCDRMFRRAGIVDYTEGFYNGDPTLSSEQAHHNQICYLLDEMECRKGSRILDVGCGNGTLLDEVRRRDAVGVGITISPPQVQFCKQRGLDVHLLNYRDIGEDWNGRFDAVVANGSIEHFVHPVDALEGCADAIYRKFFDICHRVIDPQSSSRKLINTTIHFGNFHSEPEDAMKSPWSFPWFSDKFRFALLVRNYGGYYPVVGQLERCARPYFNLIRERDATYDYHLTSEEWLRHGKRSLLSMRQWARLITFAICHPRYAARMLFAQMVAQSWNWQFRTGKPPMKQLWQTWEYRELSG